MTGRRSGRRRLQRAFVASSSVVALTAITLGPSVATNNVAAAASAGQPQRGGTLTIVSTTAAWPNFDPASANVGASAIGVYGIVYDSLFTDSANGDKVVPELATGYSVANGGLSVTLHLRHGVKFQDDTPFNAQAVIYNLHRDDNPSVSECYPYLSSISSMSAVGSYEVKVDFSSPNVDFVPILGNTTCGFMVSPTAVKKEGASFALHPVGAGPYKLVSQVTSVEATFKPWKGYWRHNEQYLNTIKYQVLGSDSSALAAIQSGSAQAYTGAVPLSLKQVKGNSSIKVVNAGFTGLEELLINFAQPPFNKINARRALIYATNQEALIKSQYLNVYKPDEWFLPESMWAYGPAKLSTYASYNLAKAKALVKQLGGLSFTLSTPNTATYIQEGEALKGEFAQAGINVTLKPMEEVTVLADLHSKNFQVTDIAEPWPGDPDALLYRFFYSKSTLNHQSVDDPIADRDLLAARQTYNQAKRKKLYYEASLELAKIGAYDTLYQTPFETIESSNLHGLQVLPSGRIETAGAWIGG